MLWRPLDMARHLRLTRPAIVILGRLDTVAVDLGERARSERNLGAPVERRELRNGVAALIRATLARPEKGGRSSRNVMR